MRIASPVWGYSISGKGRGALPNSIEHGGGKPAGERVLLAGVVTAQQCDPWRQGVFGGVGKGQLPGGDGIGP